MPDPPTNFAELPLSVRRTLDAVRRRIRSYVWVQGLAIVIITLGVIFWLGLAASSRVRASRVTRG